MPLTKRQKIKKMCEMRKKRSEVRRQQRDIATSVDPSADASSEATPST